MCAKGDNLGCRYLEEEEEDDLRWRRRTKKKKTKFLMWLSTLENPLFFNRKKPKIQFS